MKEGIWKGWFQSSIQWSGWVFTVGGAIVGLLIVREYLWIGILCFVAAYLGLLALLIKIHRQFSKATEATNAAIARAEAAERRLNAIPADLLDRLQETIRRHSFVDVARLLGAYASYIHRMRSSKIADEKPVGLRTFVRRDGNLYAVAGLDKDAMSFPEQDDPFILEFKDPGGLITRRAHLLVHQKDLAKAVVWFRVVLFLGEEMTSLDALAEKQDVPGKGYRVRVDADLDQYSAIDSGEVSDIIQRLANEIVKRQG